MLTYASVVHEGVYGSESALRLGDHALDIVLLADIAGYRDRPASGSLDRGDRFLDLTPCPRGHRDCRTCGGEALCNGPADSPSPSGDQRNLSS
jgi:hypothetical protein